MTAPEPGVDLSALDAMTAYRLGGMVDKLIAAAEKRGREAAIAKFRTLAAQLAVGWEEHTDPTLVAYGQAFKEAATRINEVAEAQTKPAEVGE